MRFRPRASGDAAENRVAAEAERRGYTIIERNFSVRGGELDLILRSDHTLVIVEVRLRRNQNFGSGADSVDARKQQRIVLATRHFLAANPQWQNTNIRFDVVSLDAGQQIEWIENAFLAE